MKTPAIFLACLAVAAITPSLSGASASKDKPAIEEKRDVPLQTEWFYPTDRRAITMHEGFLKADTYVWRVYPAVAQKFGGGEKIIELVVDLSGPVNYSYASVVVAADGETFEIPAQPWQAYQKLFNISERILEAKGQEGIVRRIAQCSEVYITVPLQEQRYSVHLSPEQIGVFKLMVEKFDSLATK